MPADFDVFLRSPFFLTADLNGGVADKRASRNCFVLDSGLKSDGMTIKGLIDFDPVPQPPSLLFSAQPKQNKNVCHARGFLAGIQNPKSIVIPSESKQKSRQSHVFGGKSRDAMERVHASLPALARATAGAGGDYAQHEPVFLLLCDSPCLLYESIDS